MAIYSDIDIELSKQLDGDVQKKINTEAIENSLENIFNTLKGSRRMLPEFATNIFNYLFEPLDETTAYSIGEELLAGIKY
jgi:phage baseplate assembly protein W